MSVPSWIDQATTTAGEFLLGKEESVAIRTRVIGGAAGVLGLRLIFLTLSFAVTVLLTRLLGPEDFGAYHYAFAWIVLLAIPALLGMDQLLIREIARYGSTGDWGRMRGLLRKTNRAVLFASVTIALVAAVICWVLGDRWSSRAVSTFWVALLLLPLISLTQVRRGAVQGLHQVVLGSIPETLIKPGLLCGLLAGAYVVSRAGLSRELTAPFAMALNVFATGVAFAVGTWLLYRNLPQPAKDAVSIEPHVAWIRSGLPLMFLSSTGIVFGQADTLILGAIKGVESVGIYSAADKASELLTLILIAQNTAFASTAASLYATGDLAGLQRLVTKLARFSLIASLPLAIVFIAFGDWFLGLCYGPQFSPAWPALAILTLGQLVNVGAGAVAMLLTMTGHERASAGGMAVGAATNIALNLLLVPTWGFVGAATGNAISMTVWSVWMVIALTRRAGIHSTALGPRTVGKVL